MCAIYGFFSNNKDRLFLKKKTEKGLELLKHRGPDDTNILSIEKFSCGVNRLAIEAISFGKQPIQNNSYIIGFNGEIFNYKEIASENNIKNFKSEIELLLILWKKFKLDFTNYIKGQYAIFIYDKINKEIFLFRDPLGIRPLFYSKNENDFVFASEVKAVINSKINNFSIDQKSIAQTSMFWTNIGNQTAFKNIFSLQPGYYLKWDLKNVETKRFYKFPSMYKNQTKKNNIDFTNDIKKAVFNQIHGEVDYGCYLSGGIDSSVLAYILSRNKKLNTFSVSFENDEYDESKYQKIISEKLKTNHTNLNIKGSMIADNFEKTIEHSETLLFRTAPVPMYLLSKIVRKKNIKVIYSGEGADEIFFGYDIFFENRIRNFWKKDQNSQIRPKLLQNLYNYLPQFKNSRYFEMIKDFYKSNLNDRGPFYSHLVRWSQYKQVSSFFDIDNDKKNEELLLDNFKKNMPKEYFDLNDDYKTQYLEISTLLSNYLLSSQGDRMTMANSVEGRYPFLDEDLIENSMKIGSKQLAPGINSKKYFRDSYEKFLPDEIIKRPKIAYQAPEAKSFINENFTSEIGEDFIENLENLDSLNQKNFSNLISKLKDKNSSKRIGFRENMAFVMGVSLFSLNKALKKWEIYE